MRFLLMGLERGVVGSNFVAVSEWFGSGLRCLIWVVLTL